MEEYLSKVLYTDKIGYTCQRSSDSLWEISRRGSRLFWAYVWT